MRDAPGSDGPVLTSKVQSALDAEVEIPDESEDDRPDDPGSAIHRKGRSSQVLLSQILFKVAQSLPAGRAHVCLGTTSEAHRSRFLSLCRLLL